MVPGRTAKASEMAIHPGSSKRLRPRINRSNWYGVPRFTPSSCAALSALPMVYGIRRQSTRTLQRGQRGHPCISDQTNLAASRPHTSVVQNKCLHGEAGRD